MLFTLHVPITLSYAWPTKNSIRLQLIQLLCKMQKIHLFTRVIDHTTYIMYRLCAAIIITSIRKISNFAVNRDYMTKRKETRVVTYTVYICRYSSGYLIPNSS